MDKKRAWNVFVLALLVAFSAARSDGRILYVNATAKPGNGDGFSWDAAYSSIQQAIRASMPGDEIWIAHGAYPATNVEINQRIALLGGFAGNETAVDQRDPSRNSTVLDGGEQPSPVFIIKAEAELDGMKISNARTSAVRIDGFNPALRNVLFMNNQSQIGGALLCENGANPIVDHCAFIANQALEGGAIAILNSSPMIRDCKFLGQETSDSEESIGGGAVTCSGASAPTFIRCEFERNAGHSVGAALCRPNTSPVFQECVFRWNRSKRFGGALFSIQATIEINQCVFEYNQSDALGGGAYFRDSATRIVGSHFRKNQLRQEGGTGGAVCAQGGTIDIIDSVFENNASERGAGLFMESMSRFQITDSRFVRNASGKFGGGCAVENAPQGALQSCWFVENSARVAGGGLWISNESTVTIHETLFQKNMALLGSGAGGGLLVDRDSKAQVSKCEFQGNQLNPWISTGGGAHAFRNSEISAVFSVFWGNYAAMGAELSSRDHANLQLLNCTLYGDSRWHTVGIDSLPESMAGGLEAYGATEGNAALINCLLWNHAIEIPHQFDSAYPNVLDANGSSDFDDITRLGLAAPASGDFRLTASSPLIDQGIGEQPVLGMVPIDGDGDGAARWDIGAFEYKP